jgi:hypothetical protein
MQGKLKLRVIRATKDGAILVWQDGILEGDQVLIDSVEAALRGDTSSWLPFGYPSETSCPHAVVLALQQSIPGVTIEEIPALLWHDEVLEPPHPDIEDLFSEQ